MSTSKAVYWAPLLILALFTPFSAQLDLALARFFYDTQGPIATPIYDFIFYYLPDFTWLVMGCVILLLPAAYLSPKYKQWRKPLWYLITTLIIGAGLIVHLTLKDHWGRPRPKQTTELGGDATFKPFYKPDFSSKAQVYKSFPCGHCSVGFFFFSFMVLGKRYRHKGLYYGGLACAILTGGAFGIARMGQGGHFFSDVLVCAAVMWWTAWIFDSLFFEYERKHEGHHQATARDS